MAVHRFLTVVASPVAEEVCLESISRLQGVQASVAVALGLSSCSFWALECRLNSCGTQA